MICFCLKLTAYSLLELLKKFLLKNQLMSLLYYFYQFCSLVSLTIVRIFFPVDQNPIVIIVLFSTNGVLGLVRRIFIKKVCDFWISAHSEFSVSFPHYHNNGLAQLALLAFQSSSILRITTRLNC